MLLSSSATFSFGYPAFRSGHKQLAPEQMPEQHERCDEQYTQDDAVEKAVHPAAL